MLSPEDGFRMNERRDAQGGLRSCKATKGLARMCSFRPFAFLGPTRMQASFLLASARSPAVAVLGGGMFEEVLG
jgi:hypothetical protein